MDQSEISCCGCSRLAATATTLLKNINGQPFVILHYFGQDYYCIKPFESITAIMVINNMFIGFEWECAPHDDGADFSKKAYQTLESIRIKWKN